MSEELTVEQEDELLRAEMAAMESGTNDPEEYEEVETDAAADEPVQEAEDEPEAPEVEEAPKKKNKVAKILAEKNQYKREAEEAKRQVEELKERLGKGESLAVEDLDAVIDKRIAEKMEVQDFFARNPEALEHKEELDEFREENPKISYDRAYKLFLAETNPQALLDEQTRNKLGAEKYRTAGRVPPALRTEKKELDYSDEEFEALVKAGKVRI